MANDHGWLLVDLRGSPGNRAAVGARVEVVTGDLVQVAEVKAGSSYLSANDPRVFFGLGERTDVDEIRVRWPDGQQQVLEGVEGNRRLVISRSSR